MEATRFPVNGGGTPNLGAGSEDSSIGCFGGRGGGGGPGFARAFDAVRTLDGGAGAFVWANLPASAMGGGARNFKGGGPGGGDACLGGEGAGLEDEALLLGGAEGASVLVLLAGGGAGGGPLLDAVVPPVFCGLIGVILTGGALGGGGGGALDFRSDAPSAKLSPAFFCSIYSLMKSAFSSI